MSAAMSKLLHSSAVWGEGGLTSTVNRSLLVRPQRQAALRTARCYRTVSEPAALMLAGIPPADLIVAGVARVRRRIAEDLVTPMSKIKAEEREATINEWDLRWKEGVGKADWTRCLIPDMRH